MNNDCDLLRHFAETQDESCFATFVQRHIGFVYAVSVRRLRDPHAAQDATQAVFVALARKAGAVARCPSAIGWLHRSAFYETRNIMRAQGNRLARETEAQRLGMTISEPRAHLEAIEAMLDDALDDLPSADREAILARYFSGSSYAEIGTTLRLSENATRMRVERALVKLRVQLARRGVTSTAAALAGALPAYASAEVPSGLVACIAKASVLGIANGTGATAIIGFMSTAKVVTGIALVAAIGGSLYEYHRTSELETSLAEARADGAASGKQLQAIQREIADLKQRAVAAEEARSSATVPVTTSAPAAAPVPTAPPPGVTPKPPKGWFQNGSSVDLYEVGVDENNAWGGMPSAYAKSTGAADGKFGGMMQTISAEAYQNQRVRLNGWVKTEDANDGGGHLWLRIDGQGQNQMLGFDNMNGRAPKGTTDWQDYSIVLDVPADATKLNYGFFVQGKGQMWVNGVTITPVGNEVPTTNLLTNPQPSLAKAPVNLGFAPPEPTK
jgi:RNA polymerase sigma factor (sigma-70 family)